MFTKCSMFQSHGEFCSLVQLEGVNYHQENYVLKVLHVKIVALHLNGHIPRENF